MPVRHMDLTDVEQVAVLCDQFGYPASREEVEERFHYLQRMIEEQVFVVEDNMVILGWIHVQGIHSLSLHPMPRFEVLS
ncbi:hypothetical protein [Alicyclobacillus sp. SO9]|uniref:hypothetical protein n=1 Tax=Alicyclobacillus sp. SO9 TaxID=2665646 RepID=UPI0018E7B326|nr:hypothetical protein [Alicyclobacillus sp. SO9]QQE81525.1 hypothetical protein GI364_08315 [Alicyclobacillus sp. SO9]